MNNKHYFKKPASNYLQKKLTFLYNILQVLQVLISNAKHLFLLNENKKGLIFLQIFVPARAK